MEIQFLQTWVAWKERWTNRSGIYAGFPWEAQKPVARSCLWVERTVERWFLRRATGLTKTHHLSVGERFWSAFQSPYIPEHIWYLGCEMIQITMKEINWKLPGEGRERQRSIKISSPTASDQKFNMVIWCLGTIYISNTIAFICTISHFILRNIFPISTSTHHVFIDEGSATERSTGLWSHISAYTSKSTLKLAFYFCHHVNRNQDPLFV